jgi:Ferritin-like domain
MAPFSNDGAPLIDRLARRIDRRRFAKSGAAAAAGVLSGAGMVRAAVQESPAVSPAINALFTLEAFAVTFYGAARGRSDILPFEGDVKTFVLAGQCEEEAHYHFFEAAGALSITTTFTIPDVALESIPSFFGALVDVESILVGAYMAAVRQFATAGDPRLVEIGYQIGAVEAQHLALTRLLAGERLGSNRAFAKWLFASPEEAVQAIQDLGYINGEGTKLTYPGPVDRYCRGVTGLVAESLEDQPLPISSEATPIPTG